MSQDLLLFEARKKLVKMYLAHPGTFPDGIEDRKSEQWYTPKKDYWHDVVHKDLKFSVSGGVSVKTVSKVTDVTTDTPEPAQITEIEVERLLKAGKSVRAIAQELDLTPAKIQRIKAKLV